MNKTWKWIGKSIGNRKWMIALLVVIQGALAASGVYFALLMREVVDCAVALERTDFWQAILKLALLIVGQVIFRWLERFIEDDTKAAVENRLRQNAFAGILKTDYAKMKEFHTGELMNRITSDTTVVTDGTVTLIPSLLSMIVRIAGVLLVMGSIDMTMALVFLIGGCLMVVLSIAPRKWQKTMHKRVQESDGKVRSFVQESLESLLIIHAFGSEKKILKSNEEKMATHRKERRKRSHVFNLFGTGLRICVQCGYLFGFVWCGMGMIQGNVSYGTLTAVIQLIGQIQMPFANIGGTLPKYASALASAERLMELEQVSQGEKTKSVFGNREEAYAEMKSLQFDRVSFAYDEERPVLSDASFEVFKGEFAALIGSSGIGKSTIMKLLLSVYEPNSGAITMRTDADAVRVSDMPTGMFAYVPQGNYLMSGPIWQVVGFTDEADQVDRKRVEEACRIACADEFIQELPNGYDTELGERGDGLSEGQMQRLAVARAVYSGCPILLLDEATSALDSETERRMITSLKEMSNYTVFIVTHRKEVWELCDRVLERKEESKS